MTQQDVMDPADAAMDAEYTPGPRTQFGEMQVDVWFCVLRKGEGKVQFDPGQHSIDERRTAIEMTLIPTRTTYGNIERQMIAESKEWASIIKPSLKTLNLDLKSVNGRFVQVQLVPTGRKYTNSNGEEKETTAFRFIAAYPGLDECLAAAAEFYTQPHAGGTPIAPPVAPAAPASPNDKERETALRFLPALWTSSSKDVSEFAKKLAGNPLTSKYFTLDSPEVIQLIAA